MTIKAQLINKKLVIKDEEAKVSDIELATKQDLQEISSSVSNIYFGKIIFTSSQTQFIITNPDFATKDIYSFVGNVLNVSHNSTDQYVSIFLSRIDSTSYNLTLTFNTGQIPSTGDQFHYFYVLQ